MGVQFDEYLSYTVFLCVAETESIREAEPTLDSRWDLRTHGWPKQPTTEQVGIARKWIRRQFDRICEECGFRTLPEGEAEIQSLELASTSHKPEDLAKALTCPLLPRILHSSSGCVDQETLKRLLPFFGTKGLERGGYSVPGISPTSEDAIIERAIRALYDWRATLNFLSELQLVDPNTLLIEEAEQAVIDGFNVHITRGRKPNLIHNMLCHLAGPARFRVILTTNFDSLIEDAFQEMKERVEVISVSIKGSLPDPEIVHARNTLVKMHGTVSETRADFSLDESPSRENKRRFFHYVRGSYPDQSGGGFLPSQLLVCGYSGADNRCVEMIKYVLDAGAPDANVYWICYSKADLERVNHLFRESAYKGNGAESRVIATVAGRCDLLLYELFERLCLSLPGGGPSQQYSYHVPPDVPKDACDDEEARRIVEGISWFREPAPNKNPSRSLLVVDGKIGVVATLRKVLQILTEERKASAIWLELQEYQDTYCVAYEFLQVISNRLGLFQLSYADLLPARLIHELNKPAGSKQGTWCAHIRFLVDHYFGIVPGKWVIVLYGRKGPGGCAGWNESSFWQDADYGTEEEPGRFPPFVKALCQLGFHVIYAPYSEALRDQNERKIETLRDILRSQYPDVQLKEPDKEDYPNRIPVHQWECLQSPPAFPPQECAESSSKSDFPAAINHWCKEPDKLGLADFDRSMKRLFENWISSHATRNAAPQHSSLPPDDKNASDRHRQYLENLQFLYAVTLFRRARHYSSFLGQGVFPAIHMSDILGYDNDWERDKKLAQHLTDLNQIGFLYRKPGGFAWTYRDFRLGVRRLIDSLPESELKKHDITPFVERRSHYHYWIADWYLRAFYTSGHAVPLMEGIYHLNQAILHLDQYRKSENEVQLPWRRYGLWREAVCDMTKALRVGNDSICLWFGPPLLNAWFSSGNDSGEKWSADFVKRIKGSLDTILSQIQQSALNGLQEHSKHLLTVLQEELLQLARRGQNELRIRRLEDHVVVKGAQQTNEDLCKLDKSLSKDQNDLYNRSPEPVSQLCCNIKKVLDEQADSDELDKAIQKWRHDQLQHDPSDAYLFSLVQQLNERAFLFLRDAKLRQLVNLNEEQDRFLFLRDAKLRQLVNLNEEQDRHEDKPTEFLGLTAEVKHRWICVTILTRSALKLCRLLHPTLGSLEGKERVKALCLYSVGLARLYRFYEAHRALNEAHALLSKINVSGSDLDVLLGILELRRAEVHILEGMLIRQMREKPDRRINRAENAKVEISEDLYARYSIRRSFLQRDETRLERMCIAKIDDAWCALERSERLLSGRLRSSHWWSRLCVLKLRCLAEHSLDQKPTEHSLDRKPAFRPLARRIQGQPLNQVYDLLYKGLAGCQEKTRISSQLRLVDLAFRTAFNLTHDDLPLAEKALNTLSKTVEQILDTIGCETTERIANGHSQENGHPCEQIRQLATLIRNFYDNWQAQRLTKLLKGLSIETMEDIKPGLEIIKFNDGSKMTLKTSKNSDKGDYKDIKIESVKKLHKCVISLTTADHEERRFECDETALQIVTEYLKSKSRCTSVTFSASDYP